MKSRSWRWLRTRVIALLSRPPTFDLTGQPHFTTRIQAELWTPAAPPDARHGNA